MKNINVIIPNWVSHLPVYDTDECGITISNFCAIIRLYPNQCFGKEYQHVEKIHDNIIACIKQPQEQQLLNQTWLFIKDSFEENWDTIPSDTRERILKLKVSIAHGENLSFPSSAAIPSAMEAYLFTSRLKC
ncbi:hypothetical protein DFA_00470 [Cavenderia fasciculata]|uniref:Uncharacterized protein n=1 Tax=Cavenderia fasciculata TaxID=261658 RepID=F4PS11_CACFS|nr:uncharacterized protein DFA_00470 [Cavenderia fasciculata]EGG20609.1 hypothetical protein DFA_00470 [Cavenderia fasciculata]|eukprot:XP_004358459.1 hypothetical protein DFA_00470 [Cavenderia fasciculata]